MMKRWKITTAKPTPVTCENCEEGRLIVCRLQDRLELLIRVRREKHMYSSHGVPSGYVSSSHTFLRYLDPDPDTPKQVRFADVADGVVFSTHEESAFLNWKCGIWEWAYDTEVFTISRRGLWRATEQLVTLTGQVAELVEEE